MSDKSDSEDDLDYVPEGGDQGVKNTVAHFQGFSNLTFRF
jgi:hypothetical protein